MFPGKGPAPVREGVAHAVVSNGAAVVSCQQVAPIRIAIGVGVAVSGEDIACIVIAVAKGHRSVRGADQLVLTVVLVGELGLVIPGVGADQLITGDIACVVIGIVEGVAALQAGVFQLGDLAGVGIGPISELTVQYIDFRVDLGYPNKAVIGIDGSANRLY